MSLTKYNQKRDFNKTKEPEGDKIDKNSKPIFVIQKHNASHLHYDFRLAIEGVLKSWALPKEPSMIPSVRMLAVETEDHPMRYASFEGSIPKGQYGGGEVEIWDHGTFENITKNEQGEVISSEDALENGHLDIIIHGTRLKGKYAMIFFKEDGKNKNWLLIKAKDEN